MNKNTAIFVALCTLVLLANLVYNSWWRANHPKPEQPAAVAQKKDDDKKPKDDAKKADAVENKDAVAKKDDKKDEAKPEADKAKDRKTEDDKWFTLGSREKKMLATFNSRGATLERIELGDYQNLENNFTYVETRADKKWFRYGYLGNLALTEVPKKGCKINVVGPGTPAAKAGLQVGDVITSVKIDNEIKSALVPVDFEEHLHLLKPEKQITLNIVRGDKEMAVAVELGKAPIQVIRPEIDSYPIDDLIPGEHDPLSLTMRLAKIDKLEMNAKNIELEGAEIANVNFAGHRGKELANGEIDPATLDTTVEFKSFLPEHDLTVIKRYTMLPDDDTHFGYMLRLEIAVKNHADKEREVAYQLDGPNGLPVAECGWLTSGRISTSWLTGLGSRDVAWRFEGLDPTLISTLDLVNKKAGSVDQTEVSQDSRMVYAGVDSQYFATVLLPRRTEAQEAWLEKIAPHIVGAVPKNAANKNPVANALGNANNLLGNNGVNQRDVAAALVNVSCRLTSKPLVIPASGTVEHAYDLFAGPKKPDMLVKIGTENTKLDKLVYFGWTIWSVVAHLMLGLLHFFHRFIPNYGINIIMLTILVRSCMLPLSKKQAKSAAKHKELAPEMAKIKEKYKNDKQMQGKALQELFAKHKFNPLGGCLLAFVQLPIFIGLYRALSLDVELRGASLFGDSIRWCSNLVVPDMLFFWEPYLPRFITTTEGFFGLGPYFNILPIITVCLFIVQQRAIMPEPTNEQEAMQQSVMKFMTVFMGIMFYKVPAGLCLYFISSSLWGIIERKLLKTGKTAPAIGSNTPTKSSWSSTNGNGSGSRNDRKKKRDR